MEKNIKKKLAKVWNLCKIILNEADKRMKKTLTNRRFLALPSVALLICAAVNLNAQTYNYTESYGSASGYLSQGGDTEYASDQNMLNNDCAPVAAANGLAYLYSLDPAAFTANPISGADGYAGANALLTAMGTSDNASGKAAGTTGANAFSGLQAYLSPSGANPSPFVYSSAQQISASAVNETAATMTSSWAPQCPRARPSNLASCGERFPAAFSILVLVQNSAADTLSH